MKKIFFLVLFFAFPVLGATIPTDAVILQGMDKVTGRVRELSLPVGVSIDFGELTITVDKCLKKTPEETPENAAFLHIVQKDKELFSGWMFSSSPSLVAMEHPNYDIWLLECKNDPNLPKIELPQTQNETESVKQEEENAL